MDYQIKPVAVEGYPNADGVYKNEYGAWLGFVDWEVTEDDEKQVVLPLMDEDLDFVPAPDNWRELIVKEL